jgi:hypothetical protein
MVNDCLIFVLEKENLLAAAQCGFRRHISVINHLISMESQIQNCFVQRQQLVTSSLILIRRMIPQAIWYTSRAPQMEVPRPPGIFYFQHFQDRRFLGNVQSVSNVQENGVP